METDHRLKIMKLLIIISVCLYYISEVNLQPVRCTGYKIPNQIGVCVSIACPPNTVKQDGQGCVKLPCPSPLVLNEKGECAPYIVCSDEAKTKCRAIASVFDSYRCNNYNTLAADRECREDENHITQPQPQP